MRSADTDPAAEQVQIDLLRRATPARRATLARSLSTTVLQLTRRAVEERYPTASDDEINVHFVAVCYGEELARKLRRYLAARHQSSEPRN